MKHCPQCQQVYDDAEIFCVGDGSPLLSTAQSRVVVSWDENPPIHEIPTQYVSIPQRQVIQAGVPDNPKWLYGVIGALIAIILIGGAYFILVGPRERDDEKAHVEPASVRMDSERTTVPKISHNTNVEQNSVPIDTPTFPTSSKEFQRNENEIWEPEKETPKSISKKPKGYNGRVIMMNAIVRSSPSMESPAIYTVTYDEPVRIGKSAGGNNPWFRITTTSGMTGWMHGNTIEFTR